MTAGRKNEHLQRPPAILSKCHKSSSFAERPLRHRRFRSLQTVSSNPALGASLRAVEAQQEFVLTRSPVWPNCSSLYANPRKAWQIGEKDESELKVALVERRISVRSKSIPASNRPAWCGLPAEWTSDIPGTPVHIQNLG
jgi:hypothetical protein